MIRIASIDNLSGRAFRLNAPGFDHSIRFETPARVHALMTAGHCDAALLPVATLPGLSRVIEPAGDFGIACTGTVHSVQLFSSAPLGSILLEGGSIYATPKSRTSVELLKLLCLREYGTAPNFTPAYRDAEARLLIGDAAFEYAQRHGNGPDNMDLGAWWFAQTGLPFVYARWVVSRSLSDERKGQIVAWLEGCATAAASSEGRQVLVEGFDVAPEDRLAIELYYQRLRTRLSVSDIAGQSCFLQLLEGYAHVRTAPVA